MLSFAIVVGFALMVLLPCAVAMRNGRERFRDDASGYADRQGDRVARANVQSVEDAHAEEPEVLPEPFEHQQEHLYETTTHGASFSSANFFRHRVERAEYEALHAQAVAVRAHADALAAAARAAIVKAEEADAAATEVEIEARMGVEPARRAA